MNHDINKSFTTRLQLAIVAKKNPTVLGLDPTPAYVPDFLAAGEPDAARILAFNKCLIDATHDLLPAVKPQLAYYEALGTAGMEAFYETIRYAKAKGLLVIADGKRNDIGSTATQYAKAYLAETGFAEHIDALTINPFLGRDGLLPFLEMAKQTGKGMFVLVRTSNPSAVDLLDLKLASGAYFYEKVADLLTELGQDALDANGYGPLGAVVGATWPEQADALRLRLPHAFVLVPGYGAQGGSADDAVRLFDKQGHGAIVNASRSLMLAYQKAGATTLAHVDAATRAAVIAMRDDLRAALRRAGKGTGQAWIET